MVINAKEAGRIFEPDSSTVSRSRLHGDLLWHHYASTINRRAWRTIILIPSNAFFLAPKGERRQSVLHTVSQSNRYPLRI